MSVDVIIRRKIILCFVNFISIFGFIVVFLVCNCCLLGVRILVFEEICVSILYVGILNWSVYLIYLGNVCEKCFIINMLKVVMWIGI